MSNSGISSSLVSQIAGSPLEANQFVTDLNHLAQDVKSGNLTAAQGDYVTLSRDALNGVGSSTATTSASGITSSLLSNIASSSAGLTALTAAVNQIGNDLQNGNLASVQQDLLGLDATALNAASSTSANTSAPTGATALTNTAERGALIHSIVQALGAGNTSVVSNLLSQLASISPSAAGAAALEQQSKNFGSASDSTGASSSTNQLLQGLNASSSSSSNSLLSLLA